MSRQFSEEELKALEAEMEKVTVDDVLLQTLVSLVNLGARKAGLAAPPGGEAPKRDLAQTRQAIEGARALLPLLEPAHGQELGPVRDALSQLQIAYVRLSGEHPQPQPAEGEPAKPEAEQPTGPGPAQRSGRLWVPGQGR
jgi:hypothetical protein